MPKKVIHALVALVMLVSVCLPFFAEPPFVHAADSGDTGDISSQEFQFPLGTITAPGIKQSNWIQGGLNYFAGRAITIMATLAGSIAVLMLVIGGFQVIISTEDDAIKKGKQKVIFALIGLAAVFGAYIIVTTVQLLIKSIYG